MMWVESLALVGLAGVLVPVILHFLGRPRPVAVEFPAIQFLLRKRIAAARVYSLRELLILFLRAALVAAGVLVLAGPIVPHPLPTCTERGEINRDVVMLLDNSPLSGYLLPEVRGGKVRVFDLYRDLALRTVSRVSSDYTLSLVPVDHKASPTMTGSPYHDEVAGGLRSARVGDFMLHRDTTTIAHNLAFQPEMRRPALLALSLAEIARPESERVLFIQARPLAGMTPLRNRSLADVEIGAVGSPFARNEFFCRVVSTVKGRRARLLLEGEGGVLDKTEVEAGVEAGRDAGDGVLSFTPSRAGEEKLRIRLFPDDRLPYDNESRLVFVSPGWPQTEWLNPGGRGIGAVSTGRGRFRTSMEAIEAFASGFGKGGRKGFFLISGRNEAGTAEALSGVADRVARGAGLVIFHEGFPPGFRDEHGILPILVRGGEAAAAKEAESGNGSVRFSREFTKRLADAGMSPTVGGTLVKVLSEVKPLPLQLRPGTLQLAWRGGRILGAMRPYGEGNVVLWNLGEVEALLARAPGTILPLMTESLFLATDWRSSVRHGEVGSDCYVPLDFRVGNLRVWLKAPSEDFYRPLPVIREGTSSPGFEPLEAGFWHMKVENPTGEADSFTIGVDAPPSPALAALEDLASPEEALAALGEADRSILSGPLCGLFLLLVVLEVLASNLLYRRVPGVR